MRVQFIRCILGPALLLLASCGPRKDAEIVGVAVLAEVAQVNNLRPSEIVVETVTFQSRTEATARVLHRVPGSRSAQADAFDCAANWKAGHWNVHCAESAR